MIRLAFTALIFACLVNTQSFAAEGFETENLVLYQPDDVLKQRLPSVNDLGDYFKKIEAECKSFLAKETQPSRLVVVVAVKPGKQSKFWFIPSATKGSHLAELEKKLEAVPAIDVYGGPFAFAVCGKIAGGDPVAKEGKDEGPPIPQEWKDSVKDAKESVRVPDGFLAKLWPDPPGTVKAPDTRPETPKEFVTQMLEPLGGKIQKPKDWHYREGHRKSTYMWTISLEDSQAGSYVTGVRIQAFVGLKAAAGKSAKEFILDFIKSKKANAAVRVVETCDETNQGIFSRMCLEIEEGPNHILYSLFWGNEIDMAVISIAGTSKELWNIYAPTFDKMNKFELIDMKRFEGKKEK
jgi:hypothetical protein